MPFDRSKAQSILKDICGKEAAITPLEVKLRKMEDVLEDGKPTEFLRMVGTDVTRKGPHLARFKTLLAECWMMTNKFDRAEKAIVEALAADQWYTPAVYAKSKLRSMQGKHEEAIEILKKMMEESPKNFSTLINLGSAYTEANQHDKAKETFGKITQLDQDNPMVRDELGKIAIKEGDLNLATQLLAETQSGDHLARYFNSMGIAHVGKSEFDLGVKTYENALKVLSNKGKMHLLQYNLGLALRKKGDLARSFEMLCQSYITDPSFEKGYVSLVRLSKEMKEAGMRLDANLVKAVKEARTKAHPSMEQKAAS
jgi:tetratricopeptide (TPR) repeat protein